MPPFPRPLAAIAVAALLLPACSRAPDLDPDPLAYRPASVAWTLQADLPALDAHMDWDAIRAHETWRTLLGQGEAGAVMDLLFTEGVDRARPVLLFQAADGLPRGFAGVSDRDSLEAGLARLGLPKPETDDGLHWVRAAGGTLAWTDDVLAYYGGSPPEEELLTVAFAVPADDAPADPDLAAFLERPGDLRFWGRADRIDLGVPWMDGLLNDFGGATAGLRLVNARGVAELRLETDGLPAETAAWTEAWFAAAGAHRGWERVPEGTPAWLDVVPPPNAGQGGLALGALESLGASSAGITAAFHQIKITRRGFIPRVSVWATPPAGGTPAGLEAELLRRGVLQSGGRLEMGALTAEYTLGPDGLVASTTEPPATLLVPPRAAVPLPDAWAEAMAASPLRVHVDAGLLSGLLPLPDAAGTLKDLALFFERPAPDRLEMTLAVRSADPEAWGADVALKAALELVPAFQAMSAFR